MPNLPEEPKPAGDGAPGPERPTEQPGAEPTPAPASIATPAVPIVPTEPLLTVQEPQPQAQPATMTPASADASWNFHEEAPTSRGYAPVANEGPDVLTWTASEFIDHEKGAGWYGLLTLAGLAIATVVYFLMKDIVSTAVILFATLAFGVFAARKPRVQNYALTERGLQIGPKMYSFQDYKNFSIAPEGAVIGIIFMPLKRFMPPLTVYVMPDMQTQVMDFLGSVLPFEQRRFDAMDGLLRRIHF